MSNDIKVGQNVQVNKPTLTTHGMYGRVTEMDINGHYERVKVALHDGNRRWYSPDSIIPDNRRAKSDDDPLMNKLLGSSDHLLPPALEDLWKPNIVTILDTSGSMHPDYIKGILAEIDGPMFTFTTELLEHDCGKTAEVETGGTGNVAKMVDEAIKRTRSNPAKFGHSPVFRIITDGQIDMVGGIDEARKQINDLRDALIECESLIKRNAELESELVAYKLKEVTKNINDLDEVNLASEHTGNRFWSGP